MKSMIMGVFKPFRQLQFWQQLVIVYTVGILALALVSSIAVSQLSSRTVRTQLVNQGVQVAESLASQSKVALLYASSEVGADAAEATLNFPDVAGAGIYTVDGEPVFSTVQQGELGDLFSDFRPQQALLWRETEGNWYFAAPVFVGGTQDADELGFSGQALPELVGYVLVDISKDSLHALGVRILQGSILICVTIAFVLLLVLVGWSKKLTSPLERLAQTMHRARGGEAWLRVPVGGAQEIASMQEAFNSMMDALERSNMELRHARDAALDSARTKGEFAANVSHELRTPMNGIIGLLDLLATMGLSQKQQEYVLTARRSSESLLSMIDDILSFSKVDAGMLILDTEDSSLEEILDEVMTLVSNDALKKNLEIGYVIAPDVPRMIHVDAAKLRQVLVNLAGNAVKFTHAGEVCVRVDRLVLPEPQRGEMVRFEVSDTGVGIPEHAHESIFQAFSQADASTTRTFGGTGLGLAIAKELVAIMGGEIRLSSYIGQGSTFWFTVPLKAVAGISANAEKSSSALDQIQVVVIDSSKIIKQFLQAEFENLAVKARYFTSGIEGLGFLREAADRELVVIISEEMHDLKAMDLIKLLDKSIAKGTLEPIILRNPWHTSIQENQNQVRVLNKPLRSQKVYELLVSTIEEKNPAFLYTDTVYQSLNFDVLVVDDNYSNQLVAVGMLEKLGCTATVAVSGKDAVETVVRKNFDLVLMDCQMPVMDGFDATRQIRLLEEGGPRLIIIAMTANNRLEDMQKCISAGMDDFLAKPLRLNSLREKILKWLTPESGYLIKDASKTAESIQSSLVFDTQVVDELRESLGDVFDAMLLAFLEDTPVYIDSLKLAVAEGDVQQVRDLAHTIKGSAGNLGARRVVELAQAIQELSERGEMDNITSQVSAMAREFSQLKKELESFEAERTIEGDVGSRYRVLVVDDDRSMRIALSSVVSQDGYLLDQASNGQHALSLCQRKMPDLILMDALMPEMDGFEACQRIRDLPGGAEVPILMITGLDDENSIIRAFSSGATDYVPKPLHFAVLRQRMMRLLQASKAEKHVKKLAYYDSLTSLPNRPHLMQTLKVALTRAANTNSIVAVLFLDLDRFKLVNDTMGHDAGDLLLKAVADRIRRCVRENDFVARLGGDEFTLVLRDVQSLNNVAQVAEKICQSLSNPFTFLQQKMYLTVSIGISLFPNDADDVATLMKHADSAMFRAKETRNRYCFYKHGMEDEIARRIELENDLRQALQDDSLELHYQPQFRATDGTLDGVEALVRWNHPRLGMLYPGSFIPLAEESGLINDIAQRVVRQACRQAKLWADSGHPLRIAINLSPRDLQAVGMRSNLAAIISEEKVAPSLLEFEITESVLLTNPEQAIEELQHFRDLGIRLAIDDFGCGFSSLNYLRRLPVDVIKIDQTFISGFEDHPEDRALVAGIIALAHSMRMETVAEGVETAGQRDCLLEMGCDFLQGYFYSRAISVDELERCFLIGGGDRQARWADSG